jgi:hypothetical protein
VTQSCEQRRWPFGSSHALTRLTWFASTLRQSPVDERAS